MKAWEQPSCAGCCVVGVVGGVVVVGGGGGDGGGSWPGWTRSEWVEEVVAGVAEGVAQAEEAEPQAGGPGAGPCSPG